MKRCDRCGKRTDKLHTHGDSFEQDYPSYFPLALCPKCSEDWSGVYFKEIHMKVSSDDEPRKRKLWLKIFSKFMGIQLGVDLGKVS